MWSWSNSSTDISRIPGYVTGKNIFAVEETSSTPSRRKNLLPAFHTTESTLLKLLRTLPHPTQLDMVNHGRQAKNSIEKSG
jgi:hypothetical protein